MSKAVSHKKATSLKEKAPLSGSSKERLIATIQQQHIEAKGPKDRLSDLGKDINSNSITVNESLEGDIFNILGKADLKKTLHMDFFLAAAEEIILLPKVWQKISSPPDSVLPLHSCISICVQRAVVIRCLGFTK